MSVQPDPDRYVSLKYLAEVSGLSKETIRRALDNPRDLLPSFRVGRRILVRWREFDAWMARRQCAPEGTVLPRSEQFQHNARRMLAKVRPTHRNGLGHRQPPASPEAGVGNRAD